MEQKVNTYQKELLANQVWQGLNFGAKALFLAVLTPLMIHEWGTKGYGEFALASSLLVSMAILDGGVRNFTRLSLCEALARGDLRQAQRTLGVGLMAFGLAALAAFIVALILASVGLLGHWLQLSAEGNWLLAGTMGLIGLYMFSVVALEPLAAAGKLSLVKAANTVGAVAALPVVGGWVWWHGSVSGAVVLYFLCLIVPNLWLIVRSPFFQKSPWRTWVNIHPREVIGAWRGGWWYYVTTLSLITKTHALTFVVSAVSGPATAGLFYILLRLTEIMGNLGSTASETALASLSADMQRAERAQKFRQAWHYAAMFTFYGALGVALAGDYFLQLWLGSAAGLPLGVGWALAAYGLAGSFSKVVVNASMGLGLTRGAAMSNALEALIVVTGGAILPQWLGLNGVFWAGAVAALVLWSSATRIAEQLGQSCWGTWGLPCARFGVGLILSALVLGAALFYHQLLFILLATVFSAGIVVWEWRRLHRSAPTSSLT